MYQTKDSKKNFRILIRINRAAILDKYKFIFDRKGLIEINLSYPILDI